MDCHWKKCGGENFIQPFPYVMKETWGEVHLVVKWSLLVHFVGEGRAKYRACRGIDCSWACIVQNRRAHKLAIHALCRKYCPMVNTFCMHRCMWILCPPNMDLLPSTKVEILIYGSTWQLRKSSATIGFSAKVNLWCMVCWLCKTCSNCRWYSHICILLQNLPHCHM